MVIYCKSVHFDGFEDAKRNLSFYEMSSYKEGKAVKLAEESGEPSYCQCQCVARSSYKLEGAMARKTRLAQC